MSVKPPKNSLKIMELNEAIKRGGDLQLGPKGRNATLEKRVDDVLSKLG